MEKFKLTIELIPESSFFENVRNLVTKTEWDNIRDYVYAKADYLCQICGNNGQNEGFNHRVECHELWEYNLKKPNNIQKLTGLVSLCPLCHKTKHIGLATINKEYDLVLNHFCNINNCNKNVAKNYVEECFKIWKERSKHKWILDLECLEKFKNIDPLDAFLS